MRRGRSGRMVTAIVALALLAAACGDDSGVGSGDAGGTGSTSEATSTSVAATTTAAETTTTTAVEVTTTAPATTAAPTTEPPTTPAPTEPPTTPAPTAAPTSPPTTAPPGPSALPGSTHLEPGVGMLMEVPPGEEFCDIFPHAGWVTVTCESFLADRPYYAIVQRAGDDGRHRIFVMHNTGAPAAYQLSFSAEEPGAGTWSGVTVVHGSFHFGEGPFNGDAEGLWVGYRYEGTGQYLDVDIIEWFEDGSARRFALHGLDHGVVDVRPGGADVVSAEYAPGDPGCCPSGVRVRELSWSSDRWRIDAGVVVPPDDPSAAITGDL